MHLLTHIANAHNFEGYGLYPLPMRNGIKYTTTDLSHLSFSVFSISVC
jgi:hypothetical protein